MQDTAQLPVRLERLIRPRNRHPCTRTRTHSRKSRTKNEAYMRACVHTKIISKRRMTKKERGSSEEGENRHITFPYSTISFNFFFSLFCVCGSSDTQMNEHMHAHHRRVGQRLDKSNVKPCRHRHAHTLSVSGFVSFNFAFNIILSAVSCCCRCCCCLCVLGFFSAF